jgi:hypothetical protein
LSSSPNNSRLLEREIAFPEHVIFRTFARETVALNLKTGRFHGLNVTAGRMVQVLQHSSRPSDAVRDLADEYGVPASQIESDLEQLIRMLLERELVELSD